MANFMELAPRAQRQIIRRMEPLEPPALHQAQAAYGWLELGNVEEAFAEAILRRHQDDHQTRDVLTHILLHWEPEAPRTAAVQPKCCGCGIHHNIIRPIHITCIYITCLTYDH